MFRVKFVLIHIVRRQSSHVKHKTQKHTYKDTLLLPKSTFEVSLKNVPERDRFIEKEAKFEHLYEWQREHRTGREFVLHDGPPYANGDPHMGHAINKITKDIILRSQLVQGRKVHFVPGWDCHGLPIELIALKENNTHLTPIEIRNKSKQLATSKIGIQKEAFKKWGLLGNWDGNCYYTYSVPYVINQLNVFWKLFEKGFIYHGLKPVYWSPSTRTALAEAELVYKNDHVSSAVTVQFEILSDTECEPMNLLVWTTTPWTLPLNEAVFFSKKLQYSLVKISSLPGTFIISTSLISENEKKLNKEITIVRPVSHEELGKMKYRHPWRRQEIKSIFESSIVAEVATGFLHSVPSHGHDDYLLGIKHGLPVGCFVDESGCYVKNFDPKLGGLSVLGEGSLRVMEELGPKIICKESYEHKYPYDWRSNEPVIIRASYQWFIDVEKILPKAMKCLSEVEGVMVQFEEMLKKRPYWCISRQRVWGVPIPVFISKETRKPLVSRESISHLCKVFEKYGTDSWWSLETKDLLPERFCDEFGVKMDDVERGSDIMDIWFDSGISWSFALNGKISDVYVEGSDQLQGWFQTSLLTSVGVRSHAPYKKLLVHGFAVDSDGRKMSKSLGNVFDPREVVEGASAMGVDTLRWWVASHSHNSTVPISMKLLQTENNEIQKIRRTMKFLLGSLNDWDVDFDRNSSPNCYLDIYLLDFCYKTYHSVLEAYNMHDHRRAIAQLLFFISKISSLYITSVKDRLYCDESNTIRRRSCVYTISGIVDTLCLCIAPILPHLVEEVYMHHPKYKTGKFFYNEEMWMPPETWKNESAGQHMKLVETIKKLIVENHIDPQPFSCLVEAEESDCNLLKELQGGEERSVDSELTELLQVADAEIKVGHLRVTMKKSASSRCVRCRRYTAVSMDLCSRCAVLMSKSVSSRH